MEKKFYILNVIALATSDFADPECESLIESCVVTLKSENVAYKKAVLKKIAKEYVGAHAEDSEFEQEFSAFGGKLMLTSEWDYGYQGYELYGYRVELAPCEVKEL